MKRNPAKLAVSLLTKGVQIDPSCSVEKNRPLRRRAGLGSGIEMIVCGNKNIWINVAVQENFATKSPYSLVQQQEKYFVKLPDSSLWPILLPNFPKWYTQKTTSGVSMSRIGVLQGTYLGIYIGKCCAFWRQTPRMACHFCASGINVGVHEESQKSLQNVIETAKIAKKESGITFVHLNSGYQEEKDIELMIPFVKALKTKVGVLVGVQCIPPKNRELYKKLLEVGVDHFSLCYEFHNPTYFENYLPGKAKYIGQQRFFNALEYLCDKMPSGSVSGEIIAGIEPLENTLQAIDYITSLGAFPTVCIFRPLVGTTLENHPPPKEKDMLAVLEYTALQCLKKKIPIGMVPNLEVSLVMTPEDARYLLPNTLFWYFHHSKLSMMKILARPYFALKSSCYMARIRSMWKKNLSNSMA